MTGEPEPLTTYLELRASTETGEASAGLSHKSEGLVLFHVLELAAWGEPRGGVTILHDVGEHGGRYVKLARVLTQAQWAVALPDLRGHGRSEGERGHSNGVKEIVRDLEAVQDHLAYRLPDAPKVLVGCGVGAIWALTYALEKPGSLAALALISPCWQPRFELPKPSGGLLKMFKKVGPSAPGRIGVDPRKLTGDAAEQAAWSKDELVHDVITLRAGEQALESAARAGSRLAELDVPVLIQHGGKDAIADAEESRRKASGRVKVEIYPDSMHALFHDRDGARAAADLREWISTNVA